MTRFVGIVRLSGMALVAASVVAIHLTGRLPGRVALAVVLVGVAAAVAQGVAPRHPAAVVMLVAPPAYLLAVGGDIAPRWMQLATALATAVGGALVAAVDRRHPTLAPVLFAISAIGLYGTVPDTERALTLAAVSIVTAVLNLLWRRPGLGWGGAAGATAVFAWVVGVDGQARPGAIVGGLACLGLFVVLPAIGITRSARSSVGLVAVHLALVGVASRVAGLREDALDALLIVAIAYVVAALLVARGRRRIANVSVS